MHQMRAHQWLHLLCSPGLHRLDRLDWLDLPGAESELQPAVGFGPGLRMALVFGKLLAAAISQEPHPWPVGSAASQRSWSL